MPVRPQPPADADRPPTGQDDGPPETMPFPDLWRWARRLIPGPDDPVRRRAAFRGAVAALVVLLVGLPFAITLPGSDAGAPPASRASSAQKKAETPCRRLGVEDPVAAPGLGAPGEAFTVFGPTVRDRQGAAVPMRRVEVWLNAATPRRDGKPLADGPIELLGEEKAGRACSFTVWAQIPELRRGSYAISVFAITPKAKRGFEELGTTELEVATAGRPVDVSDVRSFVAAFLKARVGRFPRAARGLVSREGAAAFDEKKGSLAPLVDDAYRRGTVTDVVGPVDGGVYEVSVSIARTDTKPLEEAYLVGPGENAHGDALSLLVLSAESGGR